MAKISIGLDEIAKLIVDHKLYKKLELKKGGKKFYTDKNSFSKSDKKLKVKVRVKNS